MDSQPEPIPKFPSQPFSDEELGGRLDWLEKITGRSYPNLRGDKRIPTADLKGKIENPIGTVQMPVGLAGPLLIQGEEANGIFYVPLATTEGALVASYERGMSLLSRAGGARTHVFRDENQICPVFKFDSLDDLIAFKTFLESNQDQVRELAESTTAHGKLIDCTAHVVGLELQICFRFGTGDAHGMNMLAKAADHACQWLSRQKANKGYLVYSGLSSEKRPSGRLLHAGKGKGVVAVADIPAKWVRLYLRSTPEEISDLWHRTVVGNIMANAIGYGGHYANGLTALFIACGQDVANIMNSAIGLTEFQVNDAGDLRASVTLPSLTVATIGGGTGIGTSRDCLEVLGCLGTGKARKLAEIAAATALAGELSFAGALCSGEFVQAHESLGRNRPENPDTGTSLP